MEKAESVEAWSDGISHRGGGVSLCKDTRPQKVRLSGDLDLLGARSTLSILLVVLLVTLLSLLLLLLSLSLSNS